MLGLTYRRLVLALVVLVLVTLVLTACQSPGEDPFQAGQQFREQVDQLMREVGEFVAGFCSASLLPVLATGLAAFALRKGTH